MSTSTDAPTLAQLGPLKVSEPTLSRRIRLHQAWYRYAVLGVHNFGSTRPPTSRPLGSILPRAEAQRFSNLIGPAAVAAYQRRRLLGWGVDPVRTLEYLTSSQALTINLFGALQDNLRWCQGVLNLVLGPNPAIESVSSVEIEFQDPKRGLGDRTIVDVLIRAMSDVGPLTIAVETKLGDRFNSRVVEMGDAYGSLKHLWTQPSEARRQEFSQLARAHALAEHVSLGLHPRGVSRGLVLLIHHPGDLRAVATSESYSCLTTEPTTNRATGLNLFLTHMATSAPDEEARELVRTMILRYVDLDKSESIWQEYSSARRLRSVLPFSAKAIDERPGR